MAPKKTDREAVAVLKAIAFADMGDYIKPGPDGGMRLRPEALADPLKMKAVEYLEIGEHGNFKIRLHDKLAALKELKPYLELEAAGRALASFGITGLK